MLTPAPIHSSLETHWPARTMQPDPIPHGFAHLPGFSMLALSAVSDGVFVTDPCGNILWVNHAFTQMTGYEPDEALGRNPRILKSGAHDDAFFANLWQTIQAGRVWRGTIRNRCKDGSHYDDEHCITPVRGEDGETLGFIATMRDVTERRQAESQRSRMANQLQLVLDSTGEGIYGVDLEGRCTFLNRAAQSMLGRSSAEMLDHKTHEAWHHKRPDGSPYPVEECPMNAALRNGAPCRIASEVFWRKDGSSFPVEYSSHPIVEDGAIRGAVVSFCDITEKKQLEAQFLRSQRMESIGALSGGIAHDLNNALAPVLIASEFLRMRVSDPEDARILGTIHECAQRGAGMVKQILAFARGTGADTGVVQVKHLLGGMIDIARQTFPKSIQIRTDVARDVWIIPGNATQLHQVLLNLCVNARDAMPDGGTLTLTAANLRLDESQTGLPPNAKPGPYVVLTVRDTGTGMTPEVCAHIFEPFFTTKEPDKGTGLGLSTAREILKSHHGFITLDSKPGRGTEFKTFLPAIETPAEAAPKAAPPELPMGSGQLILVVDDEAAIRTMNTHILQMFGYNVLTASDGAQAVAVCVQHLTDVQLVITDIAMPVMDGPAAICAIRSLAPGMRFLVTSGIDSETCVLDRLTLEAQAFIAKPFSAEELLRTVHRVLHEKR